MNRLVSLIECELTSARHGRPFTPMLEQRFQQDISARRRRHLIICLVIGILSYDSFLVWWWLLLRTDFSWAAWQMIGIANPVAIATILLLRRTIGRWRETLALAPFYIALLTVYNVVINGPHAEMMNQTLFIFSWPLILIYVNTCMRSPLLPALLFNSYALLVIGVAVHQAPVSFSVGGLMLTVAWASAFFSLLANYWINVEGRRSYLYVLREELRAASLSNANQDLRQLSETDTLTGLANRRQLQSHLERLWARHCRGEAEGALLLVDIDHFKRYNDHYGHLRGDDCLREIAVLLEQSLRPEDLIIRFGGEEFVVLLRDVERESAIQIAKRLLQTVRARGMPHLGREDGHAYLSVSLGLAHSSLPGVSSAADLLEQADRALYQAKDAGRDCLAAAGDETLVLELASESCVPSTADLRNALTEGQLRLHFQPLYRLAPYRLAGYECLLRWQHPRLGPIPPDQFVALAERSGLIGALGDWVLEQACRRAMAWPAELTLSVNLSPLQLLDAHLAPRLAAILAHSGLTGDRLLLELTEGAALDIDAQVLANVERLRTLGVALALDDFGSGHANLSRLLQLPLRQVKLDRQVLRIADPARRRAVLQALLDLGRACALEVLCEGVETAADLVLLDELGLDLAQGYLLGRPQTQTLENSLHAAG